MKKLTHYFYKAIDVATDILIIPIIILCAICTVSLFSARNNGEVPYLFGIAATRVLSGSMVDHGFNIGDAVLLQQVPINEIGVGDFIGFYDSGNSLYYDIIYPIQGLTQEQLEGANAKIWSATNEVIIDGETVNFPYLTYLNVFKDHPNSSVKHYMQDHNFIEYMGYMGGIYESQRAQASTALTGSDKVALQKGASNPNARTFHEVIGIFQDTSTGKLYFQTNGPNSNVEHDDYYIPEDYVIGKYNKDNGFLKILGTVIGFCGSLQGIIWLVEVPCGIMLLMLAIQLIQQIDEFMQDKSRRKRALENPMLKNRARAVEGRRIITKKITSRFKIWFNKFLYFHAGDEKGMEVRKVRNAKLTLRKSMETNFSNKPATSSQTVSAPNSNNPVNTTTTTTKSVTKTDEE